MANVNQLYTVLNVVASEALGESATTVQDTTSMVSLGNDVLSSETSVDRFVGVLFDRIGKTIISSRAWNDPESDPLVRKPFDFGAALQKIYVDILDASANNAWNIGQSNYAPTYAPVTKPDVRQKLFNSINTWEFDMTVPDNILRTAFLNETEMMAFISSLFTAMNNSMQLSLRNANNLTRATAAAYVLNGGGNNAINVLGEYNTITGESLTLANMQYDTSFLQYLTKRVLDVLRYMSDMSRAWNNEEFARHTPDSEKVLTMLQTIDSAAAVYLKSSTFHDNLLDLGLGYNTVSFWQGAGEAYAFNDISAVKIDIVDPDPESATGKLTVSQTGVLAMLYDREAMGTTINNRRSSTERNNKDEYTNYYSKANIGYFADRSENTIVFYAAE